MGEPRKNEVFDPHNLSTRNQLEFEIAQELGLDTKITGEGQRGLTAKKSDKIGGLITKRRQELKKEVLQQE